MNSMNNDENTMQNDQQKDGSNWWRSLDQYNGDPEFAKRAETEFMSSPFKTEDGKDGVARRDFLKLMGASVAMATTACIRRPVEHIIPYAQAPKEIIPGIPNFYASTWFDGTEGAGLLVKTLEGRPIKLEGNPLHPMNLGALPARAHAEVLALYDPDRLKAPSRNLQNKARTNYEGIGAKWDDIDAKVVDELGKSKGAVAILSSTLPSPSTRAIIADFTKSYGGRWVQYDSQPVDAVIEAQRRSYGKAVLPRYRFDQAHFVVSIDADFIGTYISPTEFQRQWSKKRKPGADMGRMVCFESLMTLTGMNADDRYRIKPSQQVDVVLGLMSQIVKVSDGAAKVPGGNSGFLGQYSDVATRLGIDPTAFAKVASELWAARGKSLVIAGGLSTQTSEAIDLQVAVNMLNSILGNDGATIDHDGATLQTRQGSGAELAKLITDMQAGKIKTLIIHNINAAYVLAADSGFKEALGKVDLIVYTGNRIDETGRFANYVLPNGMGLESWGDFELQSGLISIQQPTIRPLLDSRSFEESLLAWTAKSSAAPARAKSAKDWHEYVRGNWKTDVFPKAAEGKGKSFDEFWMTVLQQGVVDISSGKRDRSGSARTFASSAVPSKNRTPATGFELVIYPSVQLADGRYANIPWLQELPDPVTKIVWDNYLMISPAAARNQNLRQGDVVSLKVGGKSVNVPVHIQPGVHDEVVGLAIGYGRPDAGKVAKDIGINAFELVAFNGGNPIFSGQVAELKKTGENYRLVSTQDHHNMEGRQIVVETTNAAFAKNQGSGIHRHKIFSIWPSHQYNKRRWALSVDLNSCTGCSACVIACQSENNIPVVGKRYVMEGREMHWIRVDRYFKGSPDSPEAVFQPLMCQQCETAPCETVCPVLATTHNDEGLNDMVYNRCVGTRYCSNNCPYKVRRFNWFNYSKREEPSNMALNPSVTVRSRGVMEKCTFCVQRIRFAGNAARARAVNGVEAKIMDGEIKTACQETCPTNAITFGDLNDKDSAVAKLFQEERSYALLEDLNTQPRVRYMSRVRNAERVVEEHTEHMHEIEKNETGKKSEPKSAHGGHQSQPKQHEGDHA